MLVLRELAFGPKRFTDIRAGLPTASPNVLSQRLRELEASGVIQRRKLAPPAGSWVYEMTDWGRELEPTLREFGRWAARSPNFPEEGNFSPDSMAMSMETMFDAELADGLVGAFEVRFGEHPFRVDVGAGRIDVTRAEATDPIAVIETSPPTWATLIYEGRTLEEAEEAGELRIKGDREAVRSLTASFALPDRLEPASV